MLLNKLVDYADKNCDLNIPFHAHREFHWQLDIRTRDGAVSGSSLTPLADESGANKGIHHLVPAIVRTNGIEPMPAADDVQYVLGWTDENAKNEKRIHDCHKAFTELVLRWADSPEAEDDPIAHAVGEFYRAGGPNWLSRPEGVTTKQRVLLAVDEEPANEAPSLAPFWEAEVIRRKGTGNRGVCLVCGKTGALLRTIPGSMPVRLPGADNDAALVSVNKRVYGYDLSMQLEHVPICVSCCDAIPKSLEDILAGEHTFALRGQDSQTAWWCVQPQLPDPTSSLDAPEPSVINELLSSVWKDDDVHLAHQLEDDELGRFCSLTVGGNQGRIVVQDWVDIPLTKLRYNISNWFLDQQIQPHWPDGAQHHGVSALAKAFGRWEKRRNDYTEFRTRNADRPRYVTRKLLRAAVRGVPLSPSLRAHLVHRITTDGHVDDARAALIRLALNRSARDKETKRMPPGLDPTYQDPAYLGGRLFAVLAQLQRAANSDHSSKGDSNRSSEGSTGPNTTYSDRFFTGAVRNPRAALVSGRLDAKAWFSKLRRGGHEALAHHFENQLTEIYQMLDPTNGLPTTNNLRQQEQFILGYHHQRAEHSNKNTEQNS